VTKKTDGKRRLSVRQLRMLDGITKGATPMQAALDAGYSQRSAEHSGELLDAIAMREVLQRFLPTPEKIGQRINEGLDAMETKFFQKDGEVVETREVIAWSERRMYCELAARLKRLDPGQRIEHSGELTVSNPAERLRELLSRATGRAARALESSRAEGSGRTD
jgi:phage terminase small subunit